MTDATVDEVVVTGQRRKSASASFPIRGQVTGDQYEEAPSDPDYASPGMLPDPCADSGTALEWNADALAAAIAKEFARLGNLAGEDGLNTRERGALIYLRPDGSLGFGRIHESGPLAPTGEDNTNVAVNLTYDEIPDLNWIIGSIHSHPAGNHLPSAPGPDGDGRDLAHWNQILDIVNTYRGNPNLARIYIVAQNQLGANQAPYNQINVYNIKNIQTSYNDFKEGPEVNPEAQQCP